MVDFKWASLPLLLLTELNPGRQCMFRKCLHPIPLVSTVSITFLMVVFAHSLVPKFCHYLKGDVDTRPGTGESPQLAAADLMSEIRGHEGRCDTLPVESTYRHIIYLCMLTALFTRIGASLSRAGPDDLIWCQMYSLGTHSCQQDRG